VDHTWNTIKSAFQDTGAEVLGTSKPRKTKDWLSIETRQLATERRELKSRKRDSPQSTTHYNYLCREIKRRGRADKETYLNDICKRVAEASNQRRSHAVYQGIQLICGKTASHVRSVRDKNGVVLTKPEEIRGRWREHFEELYNGNIYTDPSVLLDLSAAENNSDTPELLREKVEAALRNIKSGKSPGKDNVTADEMRASGDLGIQILHKLFLKVWESEVMPLDLSWAVIIPIFKKKDKTVCDNYSGISLLCHAEMLFASIILLTELQAGFR